MQIVPADLEQVAREVLRNREDPHVRNANQNDSEIQFTSLRMAKTKNMSAGEDMQQGEHSC